VLDGLRRQMWGLRQEWQGVYVEGVTPALEKLESEEIDAIVSDLNMPGRTGLDLLKLVRETPRLRILPFFILTGNSEMLIRQVSLEAGATEYLSKPCDFSELATRLRNAFVLKDLQDEISAEKHSLEEKLADSSIELERAQRETLFRLAKAAEARDVEVGNHIARVGAFSRLIAEQMGFDAQMQRRLLVTSPLHDIGKIGIPDSILRKPGALEPDERTLMETHCRIGGQILTGELPKTLASLSGDERPANFEFISTAAKIALSHHERWDGRGYPDGLAGEDIPIEARVVAVADVFDALRNPRPYKGPFSKERTMDIIEAGSETQFDPKVVEALVLRLDEAESILDFMGDPHDQTNAE
jgi:response regulator RpfG family c-di-GMP phosphodiesterase